MSAEIQGKDLGYGGYGGLFGGGCEWIIIIIIILCCCCGGGYGGLGGLFGGGCR